MIHLRLGRLVPAIALFAVPFGAAIGQGASEGEREAAYAVSVAHVADSAIRRLDFFPSRAQLRVQMLFLAPRDSAIAIFYEIARRSRAEAQSVDEISTRFEETKVPADLSQLHQQLLASLRAARSALDRLGASANACQSDPSSVTRCQSSFTSASSAVGQSYGRYLDVRAKIREQILDTQTVLPEFVVAGRAGRASPRHTTLRELPNF